MNYPLTTRPDRRTRRRCALIAVLLASSFATSADAPSGGNYVMRKQVVATGGGHISGGSYAMTATVAQSATGPVSGGSYVLQQGFHAAPGAAANPILFQDSFESD